MRPRPSAPPLACDRALLQPGGVASRRRAISIRPLPLVPAAIRHSPSDGPRREGWRWPALRRKEPPEEAKALSPTGGARPAQLVPATRGRPPGRHGPRPVGATWPGSRAGAQAVPSTTWRSASGTTPTALLARGLPCGATGVVAEPRVALPQDYPLVAYYRGDRAQKPGLPAGSRLRLLASRRSDARTSSLKGP